MVVSVVLVLVLLGGALGVVLVSLLVLVVRVGAQWFACNETLSVVPVAAAVVFALVLVGPGAVVGTIVVARGVVGVCVAALGRRRLVVFVATVVAHAAVLMGTSAVAGAVVLVAPYVVAPAAFGQRAVVVVGTCLVVCVLGWSVPWWE